MASQRPRLNTVFVDALVVMKIVKHARENPGEVAEGSLLGLTTETSLEVTNCFPLPLRREDDTDAHQDYQIKMMTELREVNVDHMSVGWYRVSDMGTFYDMDVATTLLAWQSEITETVILVYDPAQIAQGSLSIKAMRLTERAMRMLRDEGNTIEAIKRNRVTAATIFEEVPVVLRMSSLAKAIVPDLTGQMDQENVFDRLDLTTHSFMEKNVQLLMRCLHSLNDDNTRFNAYQREMYRYQNKVQDAISKLTIENEQREARGQPPLSEEEAIRHIKTPTAPSRLESLLANGQISTYCKQMSRFGSQSFGKLYLAQAIQPNAKAE